MSMEKVVHSKIACNGCKDYPIKGNRHWCLDCGNLDLCEICFNAKWSSEDHPASHRMLKIPFATSSFDYPGLRQDVPECCVCRDLLVEPMVSTCGHSVCGLCSFKLDRCPTCRKACSFNPNYSLRFLIDREYGCHVRMKQNKARDLLMARSLMAELGVKHFRFPPGMSKNHLSQILNFIKEMNHHGVCWNDCDDYIALEGMVVINISSAHSLEVINIEHSSKLVASIAVRKALILVVFPRDIESIPQRAKLFHRVASVVDLNERVVG